MARWAGFVWLIILGCDGDARFFIERTWPTDHSAVLVAAEGDREVALYLPPGKELLHDLDFGGPFRVSLRTYSPTDSKDLDACGVRVGGERSLLPAPEKAWISELLVDRPSERTVIPLEKDEALGRLDLRFDRCDGTRRTPCDFINVEAQEVDLPDSELHDVVLLSEDTAVATSRDDLNPDQGEIVKLRRSGGFDVVLGPPQLIGPALSLVWDQRNTLFASTRFGQLVNLDLQANPVLLHELRPNKFWIAAGQGEVIGFDKTEAFDLGAGSTSTVARADLPQGMTSLAFGPGSERVAVAEGALHYFDGSQWQMEYLDSGVFKDTVFAFGELGTMAVSPVSVLLRLPAGDWLELEPPLRTVEVESTARIAGGNFLVVGQSGLAAVWDGASWCIKETSTTRRLRGVSATPDGRLAVAVAHNYAVGGTPAAYWFDITEPPEL